MRDLLNVESLTISYRTRDHLVTALLEVSLTLAQGEILGIIGESGCGKSTFSSVIGKLWGRPAWWKTAILRLAERTCCPFLARSCGAIGRMTLPMCFKTR